MGGQGNLNLHNAYLFEDTFSLDAAHFLSWFPCFLISPMQNLTQLNE